MLAYDLPQASDDARAAAVAEFRAMAAERRRTALRGARAVAELRRTGAHYREGAASIAHFGEMNGLPAREVREFEHLARAIEADPSLAEDVERGTVPVASAAVLGEVSAWPAEVRSQDPWREWAAAKSTAELRRIFLRRRDEVRAGEPVVSVTAFVTRAVRDDIDRAVALTSRSAHAPVTLGYTLGVVVAEWLGEHDPLRHEPGTRRLGDTAELPGSRYVPAEVDRAVRRRSDDRCRVPFCDNEFWVQRSHRVPHRDGSSREADALDLLCDYHHVLYERGMLRIEGPPDAPVFTDEHGRRIDERRPWFAGDGPAGSEPTGRGAAGRGATRPEATGNATPGNEPPGNERGPPALPPAA